jgi:hypothetical protein
MNFLQIVFYFCGSFLPSWIRIPDPDPQTRLNPDPIRIRIRNLPFSSGKQGPGSCTHCRSFLRSFRPGIPGPRAGRDVLLSPEMEVTKIILANQIHTSRGLAYGFPGRTRHHLIIQICFRRSSLIKKKQCL